MVTIGGGISAMNLAYEVQYGYEGKSLEDVVEHCVYEKDEVLGGTWWVNTYPGVACDVPAHIYTCTRDFPLLSHVKTGSPSVCYPTKSNT